MDAGPWTLQPTRMQVMATESDDDAWRATVDKEQSSRVNNDDTLTHFPSIAGDDYIYDDNDDDYYDSGVADQPRYDNDISSHRYVVLATTNVHSETGFTGMQKCTFAVLRRAADLLSSEDEVKTENENKTLQRVTCELLFKQNLFAAVSAVNK